MLYCNIVAPKRYLQDERFRNRVRFLVDKWRPDKWFWSMVYMMRNVAITLVFVVVPEGGILQCSLMLVVLTTGMIVLALNRPWRDNRSNYADLGATMLLCCLCILCFNFSPEQTGSINEPAAWLEIAIKTLFCIVGLITLLSMGYAVYLFRNHMQRSQSQQEDINSIAHDLIFLGKQLATCPANKLTEAFIQFTQVDFIDLKTALRIFTQHNQLDITPCAAKKSFLPKISFLGQYTSICVGETVGSILAEARTKMLANVSSSQSLGRMNSDVSAGSETDVAVENSRRRFVSFATAPDVGTDSWLTATSWACSEYLREQQGETLQSLPQLPQLLTQPVYFSDKVQSMHQIETKTSSHEQIRDLRAAPQCAGDRGPVPRDVIFDDMMQPNSKTAVIPTCVGVSQEGETDL